jgi:hypothetical protein
MNTLTPDEHTTSLAIFESRNGDHEAFVEKHFSPDKGKGTSTIAFGAVRTMRTLETETRF